MRKRLVLLPVAWLAAFTVVSAETTQLQTVQGAESAAAATAPVTPEPATAHVVPMTTTVEAVPAAAAATHSAAAATGAEAATSTPSSGEQGTPQETAASQPITLKMATVPPPADFKIPAGYRPVKRGLDTVYCTSITPIGSRMAKTYCMTRDQVEERERQAELARREVAQKSNVAGTPSGP